ncbi:MAG: oxidoreductase [Maricaulis sp.]|jgi:NAD(P)-dependent dehydrogenase (short-subunit alcohol dehydrogenase family)|nr:oxidoreductase [Maricaulis sp.]HAQ35609.1 oxidoreductase [Alphaproteobacteria bacterium]
MSQTAVVTGASTGIGHATTKVLIEKGFHVFAGIRKDEDAARLKSDFADKVTPLKMDVTQAATLKAAADQVRAALGQSTLDGLVCNAGIAVAGPLLHINISEVEKQMDVNVLGVLRTVQAFAPLLGAEDGRIGEPGRIVMMSSVAGKMGMPFVGPYAASKHALEGMTKSLRKELGLYGINCVLIGPGAVATPIWDKAEEIDVEQYRDTDYVPAMNRVMKWMQKSGPEGLPPERIGRRVHHALTADSPRLRYAEVPQRLTNWSLPRLLPEKFVDAQVRKRIGLRPEDRRSGEED